MIFQPFLGFAKVLLCLLALIGAPSLAKEPTPGVKAFIQQHPMVSFGEHNNEPEESKETSVVLAGHLGDGERSWERTIRGTGHLEVSSFELIEQQFVATILYRGEIDLGGLQISAPQHLAALYLVYDLQGRLVMVGNLEGDEDIIAVGAYASPAGLSLSARFAGVHCILPLSILSDSRNKSVTYHFNSTSHGYRTLRVSRMSLAGMMDWFHEPPLLIAQTGSSSNDPDGDPVTPPPPKGGD